MSKSAFSSTDHLIEILELLDDGKHRCLGSGVVTGEKVVASVRHVIENTKGTLLDASQIVLCFRSDGEPDVIVKVIDIIEGVGEPDSLVLLKVSHLFGSSSIARIRPMRDAFGDDVVFCGYPERTSRAKTYIGDGSLAPGGAAVPGSNFHWAQVNTNCVYRGMSGGPVFRALSGDLVALISERATVGDQDGSGPTYCLAINAALLWQSPFEMEPKDPKDETETRRDQQLSHELSIGDLCFPPLEKNAISNAANFVGQENIRTELTKFVQSQNDDCDSIFQITGIGGIGKTALLDKFRSDIGVPNFTSAPEFQIYHSFDDDRTIEGFVEALRALAPQYLQELSFPEIIDRFLGLLEQNRGLVVLDAIENVQSKDDGDSFGKILDPELHRFIEYFDKQVSSKLIFTSRQLVSLGTNPYKRMSSTILQPLAPKHAENLYRSILSTEPPIEWKELCEAVENHPGALTTVLYQAKNSGRVDLDWALQIVRGKSPNDGYIEIIRSVADELTLEQQSLMFVISQLDDEVELGQLREIMEKSDEESIDGVFTGISFSRLPSVISRLSEVTFLEYTHAKNVSAHNIVKEYFASKFARIDSERQKRIQHHIADSFNVRFHANVQHNDMAALRPGLDTVVHLCKAKDYIAAAQYLDREVQKGPGREFIVSNRLGGVTDLQSTLGHFYPGGDINANPYIPEGAERDTVLHSSGYCQSVQGGYPDMALTKLEAAAHGAARRESYDLALNIFRAASYSAVSAGNLQKATELLETATEIAVKSENKDEGLKLLVQMTVTSHMTVGMCWKPKANHLTSELEKTQRSQLGDYISRNSLYVAFLSRTGHSRSADCLQKEVLRPFAAERGWTDIVWRYLSLQATSSEVFTSRLAAFETAVSNLSKHHRIDLRAEVANRCARYLIGENRAEEADTNLRKWTADLNLENYPLLQLDLDITILAARSVDASQEVEWEKLEEKAIARSYNWALNDIRRYRTDPMCRLV